MRTSSPLDGPAAGTPSMTSKQPLEGRGQLTCHRAWRSSTSTSQVRALKVIAAHIFTVSTANSKILSGVYIYVDYGVWTDSGKCSVFCNTTNRGCQTQKVFNSACSYFKTTEMTENETSLKNVFSLISLHFAVTSESCTCTKRRLIFYKLIFLFL